MAIPGPGVAISMNTIAAEFGGTVPHSLSEYYRGGGLVPNVPANLAIPTSGQIAMSNFYGATDRVSIPLTISTDSFNYDVYTNRGPTYSAGLSDITVTVNPGVILGSTSSPTYALLVPSEFNVDDTVTIINNGLIQAMGGGGGRGGGFSPGSGQPGAPGGVGGNAVYVNRPTTITNNGTIAGGGGGGGGAGYAISSVKGVQPSSGGGGGGGAGTNGGSGGSGGGTAPGVGQGQPGSPGTSPAGGGGGGPGVVNVGGPGGAGGGRGAAGSAGAANSGGPGAGAAAGNYIVGNPFVTWPVDGTRQGGVA